MLDEGFDRLCEDLRKQFEQKIDELNHEPEVGNVAEEA